MCRDDYLELSEGLYSANTTSLNESVKKVGCFWFKSGLPETVYKCDGGKRARSQRLRTDGLDTRQTATVYIYRV